MRVVSKVLFPVVLLLASLLCWLPAASAGSLDAPVSEAAIGGYSPVSYFTENRAQPGDPAFAVTHKGQTYYLTSAAQVQLFKADPERFLPRYSQFCPYSLAQGRQMSIDPTNFRMVGGSLLLFHRSEAGDGKKLWIRADNEAELLRKADQELLRVRF